MGNSRVKIVWQLFSDGGNLTLDNSFDIRFSRISIKSKKSVLTVFASYSQATRFFRFSVLHFSNNCHCHATFKSVTLSLISRNRLGVTNQIARLASTSDCDFT